MFEHKGQKLLSKRHFFHRLMGSASVAFTVMAVSLAIGVLGYHGFEGLSWDDSLLNASMILGGMGPVDPVKTMGGKLFASFYALYSGLLLIALMGLLLAPFFHRILHSFHQPER